MALSPAGPPRSPSELAPLYAAAKGYGDFKDAHPAGGKSGAHRRSPVARYRALLGVRDRKTSEHITREHPRAEDRRRPEASCLGIRPSFGRPLT